MISPIKKKLLIVDDEEGIVEEITDFFQSEGYDVHGAVTGEGAIQMLREQEPHLVMIDLKLPDMSGLLVLKVAKDMNPHIKAIVNTGYVDQNMVEQAEQLGCDVFLHKPFDLLRLKDEVENLFGKAKG